MVLAMAVNHPRAAVVVIRAMKFVRRTRGKVGVSVIPEPLTRCVRARVVPPSILLPVLFACRNAENATFGFCVLVHRGTLVRPYPRASVGRL